MNFDKLQEAWRTQNAAAKANINTDEILKNVRNDQKRFWWTIFWRDTREVGVAVLLGLYATRQGIRHDDWSDYLLALACFGVASFLVVDRLRQRARRPICNDSLKTCIEASLHQVSHQIWLLRNVFWWYLLPFAVAVGASVFRSTWKARESAVQAIIVAGVIALVVGLVYVGIHRLNQFAVRKTLEPRRQELESLLAGLSAQG